MNHLSWLTNAKGANPNPEWLSKTEFQSLNQNDLWNAFLAADLHFSSLPVIPTMEKSQKPVILQVEIQMDISQSLYSQISTLKDSIDNIQGREIEEESSSHENSPKTPLRFTKYILSDGHSGIWALIFGNNSQEEEYSCVSSIEEGSKILVKPFQRGEMEYFPEERIHLFRNVVVLSKPKSPKRTDKEKLQFLTQFLHPSQ